MARRTASPSQSQQRPPDDTERVSYLHSHLPRLDAPIAISDAQHGRHQQRSLSLARLPAAFLVPGWSVLVRPHLARFTWFCLAGLVVFGAGAVLQYILIYHGMGSDSSYLLQTLVSLELGYVLNRFGPFRDRRTEFWPSIIRWHAQRVVSITLNVLFFDGLVRYFGMGWLEANVITTGVFMPANYLGAYFWVFAARRKVRLSEARAAVSVLSPRAWPLIVGFSAVLAVTWWVTVPAGVLGWPLTVMWAWPILNTIIGLRGISRARSRFRQQASDVSLCADGLIVVIPTVGRHDVLPALRRSAFSCLQQLQPYFPHLSIDILIEESCEGEAAIREMVAPYSRYMRVLVIPARYRTVRGTRFKARANQFSADVLRHERFDRDNVWVLHMDDDTGLGRTAARELAGFIEGQRDAAEPKHLAQGILTYPREFALNKLTWLADSVRPADDVSRFCAWTGSGTPRSGLHGEFLLVRASVETEIGWDFGPDVLVEDAYFAMHFAERYPGRSGWLPACCEGASPATLRDFIRQRERWAWGILQLAFNRQVPRRGRFYLFYCLISWVAGPLENIIAVIGLEFLLFNFDSSPALRAIVILWSLNLAFFVWCYWEGQRINAAVSVSAGRRWWEPVTVVLLIPVLSLMEGIGALCGLYKFSTRDAAFTVIEKQA